MATPKKTAPAPKPGAKRAPTPAKKPQVKPATGKATKAPARVTPKVNAQTGFVMNGPYSRGSSGATAAAGKATSTPKAAPAKPKAAGMAAPRGGGIDLGAFAREVSGNFNRGVGVAGNAISNFTRGGGVVGKDPYQGNVKKLTDGSSNVFRRMNGG